MAIDNFIPTVWSARLLQNLHKGLVYGQEGVINRDYEGEIQEAGDSVKINSIGAVTIGTYTKNTDIDDPETLDGAQSILLIDQQKYFNFQVDDVDRVQQRPKTMGDAMREAGYGLADTADQAIAAMFSDIQSTNYIGSEGTPKTDLGTAANAYEYLVDMGVLLDENNVPSEGRWVVVPPWFHGVLQKDDRFVKQGTDRSEERLANGMVGTAAGFTIMKSNNVPKTTATTKFKIIAGHRTLWSFADQITEVEAYRPEKRFADAVKGLHVYGKKVVRPQAGAVLFANRP